jgi:hypothetical protein
MCDTLSVSIIPVKLLTCLKMSYNDTCGKVQLEKYFIPFVFILLWNEKLLHR